MKVLYIYLFSLMAIPAMNALMLSGSEDTTKQGARTTVSPVTDATFIQSVVAPSYNATVFVYLYTTSCSVCMAMMPQFTKGAHGYPLTKFYKINLLTNPQVTSSYDIVGVPTVAAFKNGIMSGTLLMPWSQVSLNAFIRKHIGPQRIETHVQEDEGMPQ